MTRMLRHRTLLLGSPRLVAVALAIGLWIRPAAAIVVACNESQVYSQAPGCTAVSDPCVIDDIVICGSSCGGSCTYNFGSKALSLQGLLGSFINATAFSTNITVSAGKVSTTLEDVLRFENGGGGKTLTITATGSGGIDLSTGSVRSTAATAGQIIVSAAAGDASLNNVDVSATASGATGGTVLVTALRDAVVWGDLNASGPAGGGAVTLRGQITSFETGDVLLNATSTGNGGTVRFETTQASYTAAYVGKQVVASGAAAGTGLGGTVYVGPAAGVTKKPWLRLDGAIDVSTKGATAGTITIDADYVSMWFNSSVLKASAPSTADTTGGTIDVTTTAVYASEFRTLEARGETGGKVKIRLAADATFNKDVNVSSNQGPSGTGGVVAIRTKGNNGVAGCWDCQEPGDACYCGVPPSCTQQIQINEDILANGNGSSGVGGRIVLEAPYVYMRASGTQRRLTTNANTAIDGTTGAAPGRVRVRARDSQFRVRTDSGTPHKVRSTPDVGGVTEICITQPLGGSYMPDFVLCGPTYSPQCNPG